MSRWSATAVALLLGACATASPTPQPAPEDASARPMHEPGTGMTDASGNASAGMRGGMHGDGMHRGRMEGEGMHRGGMQEGGMRGQGMQRGGGMGNQGATVLPETPRELREGERIFEEICSQCHTMDPPPNLAPPMSHVARHLKETFDDEAGAVNHVVTYLPSPTAEASILPEMARQRFGLMAPLQLSERQLRDVGRYIWWMANAIE